MMNQGDKCIITDSIMKHLIGKTVTIKNFKYCINDKNFYDCTIDDMNDCPLVASEKVLEKIVNQEFKAIKTKPIRKKEATGVLKEILDELS